MIFVVKQSQEKIVSGRHLFLDIHSLFFCLEYLDSYFEIYLGEQLNDGQIIFEVPNLVTLNVRCIKTEQDGFGSFNLELKREIKLPNGAKLNNISHSIDNGVLFIQVPFQ